MEMNLLPTEYERIVQRGKTPGTVDAPRSTMIYYPKPGTTNSDSEKGVDRNSEGAPHSHSIMPSRSNLGGGEQGFTSNGRLGNGGGNSPREEYTNSSTALGGTRGGAAESTLSEVARILDHNVASHAGVNLSAIILKLLERMRKGRRSALKVSRGLIDGRQLLLRLRVRRGQVEAQFQTNSKGIREVLEKGWERLVRGAADKGIRLAAPKFEKRSRSKPV